MATSITEEKAKGTEPQKKQYKRFVEDAGDRALTEVELDKDALQRLIENGGAFQDGIVELIRKHSAPKPQKFELLKDLGIIEIPADYVHAHLDRFIAANRKQFYFINDAITDANFSEKATTKLTPGMKIRVRVYRQTVPGSTTSVERVDFLKQQKDNLLLGAQGVTLVWPKRQELPKGYWACSFDQKDALWRDALGLHRVPFLYCDSVGDFEFSLGYFEDDWHGDVLLLGFSDVSVEDGQ